MKKLRCSFGFHKWHKHWQATHYTNRFGNYLFGGVITGIAGLLTFLSTMPVNLSDDQLIAGIFGTLFVPTIIGGILGLVFDTVQDKTCLDCHKHDFSHTIWQRKEDTRVDEKRKLTSSAVEDYQETKQFLKV